MNCEILSTLYIKSNGEILCNDDFGERVILGNMKPETEPADIDRLFANPAYQHIRKSFLRGVVPWEGVCEQCAFLRRQEPFADAVSGKHLTKVQIEPSLLCNLRCPCCSSLAQVASRKKPHLMLLEGYRSFLLALRNSGFRIDSIEYCGQGEPLLHPTLVSFVQVTREIYPQTYQRLITNGNFDYQKTIAGAGLDEIIISCDGLWQAHYNQYRVQGQVEKVLAFMRDAVADKQQRKPVVVWKYILFEFNDSDRELIAAQKKAQLMEVDTLLFVVTPSTFHSQRYTTKTIAQLPIVTPCVTTNVHPSFLDGVLLGTLNKKLVNSFTEWMNKKCQARIDDSLIMPGNVLQLRGWAAAITSVKRIEVRLNDHLLGETLPTDPRPDVEKNYPKFTRQPMGFRFSTQLPDAQIRQCRLAVIVYDYNEHAIGRFYSQWIFSA